MSAGEKLWKRIRLFKEFICKKTLPGFSFFSLMSLWGNRKVRRWSFLCSLSWSFKQTHYSSLNPHLLLFKHSHGWICSTHTIWLLSPREKCWPAPFLFPHQYHRVLWFSRTNSSKMYSPIKAFVSLRSCQPLIVISLPFKTHLFPPCQRQTSSWFWQSILNFSLLSGSCFFSIRRLIAVSLWDAALPIYFSIISADEYFYVSVFVVDALKCHLKVIKKKRDVLQRPLKLCVSSTALHIWPESD